MRLNFLIILLLIFGLTDGQSDLKKKKSELEEIKEKLTQTRTELAELQKKETGVLARLEMLDQERTLINRLVEALQIKENEYRSALEHVNLEIKATEATINKKKGGLKDRIIRIYRQSKFHELEIYLSSRTVPEVLAAAHYLRYIAIDDRRTFDEFKRLHRTYLYQKDNYETLIKNLKETEQERLNELAILKEENRKTTILLDSIRNERKEKKELEKELKQAQRSLEEMIIALEKSRKKVSGKVHHFEASKGNLPWPCAGKVINTYGKIRHPKYNTVTKNNGIDIKAPLGQAVAAVGAGRVVYADRFLSLGNMV
ncbi:MAG: hypothetical protein ABIL05_05115, partial [candidate division WOR-3 bacterium]